MSYLALYRKYRPTTFDKVIGQEHITNALVNQIKNNTISHAYLFCGTRGIGKTSIAKIFAKAVNCLNHENGNPCGKCDVCKNMNLENNIDILEIDAASNNRVDEIRELREKVKYPPVNGKYKVYIIDEVHMLTDSAFNALLKTLEEPPSYVVFILATTEVHKLPATILSRLVRFDFKLVSTEALEKLIKEIFNDSNIKYEDAAVSLIASLGEGSVRDALSIADMCVAYTNRNVTYDQVVKAIGATDKKILEILAGAILAGDYNTVLNQINVATIEGKNMAVLAKDLASYFRDLSIVKTCSNYSEILKYPADILNSLVCIANKYNTNICLTGFKKFASLEQDFRYTNNPRNLIELTALDVASLSGINFNNKIDEKLNTNITTFSQKEEKKQGLTSDKVYGKLLKMLREQKNVVLQTIIGEVCKHDLQDEVFTVALNNESMFNSINKDVNIDVIKDCLKAIRPNLKLKVIFQKQKMVLNNIEDSLKQKFGNLLKIEN